MSTARGKSFTLNSFVILALLILSAPTLVVLGPRCYVLEGAAVAAYGGPGTAFVAWRRRLRAALGIAHDDSFSDLLGNA